MTGSPLRIGLIGASRISVSAIIDPARARDDVVVQAVAARDLSRAMAFAREHGLARTYPDYAQLITADDVDLVYIATPPHLHADLACIAIAAGKPTLVEKPFAMSVAEALRVVEVARQFDGIVFEAMHALHHPLFAWLSDFLKRNPVGEIMHVDAGFETPIAYDPLEFRWSRANGGGALMDLGVYPLAWCRFILGEDFEVRSADMVVHGDVDATVRAEMQFASGVTASIRADMLSDSHKAWLTIYGAAGRIEIENPLVPHTGHLITLHTASDVQIQQIAGPTSYQAQLSAVVAAVRGHRPFPLSERYYLNSMRAIDQIRSAPSVNRVRPIHLTA